MYVLLNLSDRHSQYDICIMQGGVYKDCAIATHLIGAEMEVTQHAPCQGLAHVRRLLLGAQRVLPHLSQIH